MKKIVKIACSSIIISYFISLFTYLSFRMIKMYKYGNDNYYSYYLNENSNTNNDLENSNFHDYVTAIDHEVKYSNQNFSNKDDAIDLIKKEAKIQESKCNNDLEDIENKIRIATNIYGVNLCEISAIEAEKIFNTLTFLYEKYPFLKNYVTNLTLVNDGGINSYIAAFKPAFTFATSASNDKFPFVIKIQVFLNASYYLNDQYFDLVIKNASNSDHFPKDTTRESLIAHEFGHVITYILAIHYYKSVNTTLLFKKDFKDYANTLKNYTTSTFSKLLVEEAYNNYLNNNGTESEELFRKNISGYANSLDEEGDILYNETVAEAFHDYYLHSNNSKIESLEIMKVIQKYMKEVFR